MSGLSRETGKPISGIDHLRQSIIDILTTPIGSRVMRRDYGSRLYELVDAPINRKTIVSIYSATAQALRKWEPRISVKRVVIENSTPGKVELSIEAKYIATNTFIVLNGIKI